MNVSARYRALAVLVTTALVASLAVLLSPARAAGSISVYVTFEGYNLGQGYYVEPVKVTVPEGSTAAAVTESVLTSTSHPFDAASAGDTSNPGWYLGGVKGFDTGSVTVPSYISSQPGFALTGTNGDDYLGQFDYHSMSGWMYTVDNATAQVGAGAYALEDGDVVRWQFTLHGYGCDLGLPDSCYEGNEYFSQANKTALVRGIGQGTTPTATAAELSAAKAVAINPTATQPQVDGAVAALESAPVEPEWIRIGTTAQGQLLTKLREKLVSDYGQTAGSYDYSVVKKLQVSGTLNSQDYTDLRNATLAGTHITELDLSGVLDATTFALSGMTALTDVSLPPVASYTVANPFQGNTNLRNVVVAAETYSFGSATTFNGITTLQRITFLHPTKPAFNAFTFAGSNNADPAARTVTAVVPDKTRGDYDKAGFTGFFASVVTSASAEDRAELDAVIDDADAITEGTAAAPFRWALLQAAIDDAETVHADTTAGGAEVYGTRLALQTAISRVGTADLGLSVKVTAGADVSLSWKNGTAQHFAEFVGYPLTKVAGLSGNGYDIYVPTTPVAYTNQKIASAVIPGQTDKVAKIFTHSAATANAQYLLDLVPVAGRQDTSLTIPGLGAGDNRNLYTNLDDTGVLNLGVGDHFDLDTFRTQQAQLDQINNLFIEPDYTFVQAGDSISTRRVGADGRRQLRITGEQPGLSVVKITYGPLHYLTPTDNGTPGNTNWSFNGIDPQNTGVAVVNVGGNSGTFATGITVRNELDTYYFDKTVGSRDYTFTPAEGTTVRVHDPLNVSDWGTGWNTYEAAPDGSVTVKLKGGRNIVELTNDGTVQYRVVRGKGVDVTVTNTTNPGQPFVAGDTARVSILGIEGGVEKLAGIYNPAFSAGTKGKLTYYDGSTQLVSNEAPQYQTAITTFNVNVPFTGTGDKALNGDMFIGGLGAEWPFHRQIPLEGKPANLAAVAIGPYHFGGLPTIYVRGNTVSTTPGTLGAPTDLQATYGDASAQLSWAAPTPTSGLPVLGYKVRYSSNGGTDWTTRTFGTATTRTLTGLTNGTGYDVQVAAFSSAGTGAWTASQTVTPRTVPGVPTDLVLTARHTAIDASWTAPADGGSTITGYQVRYSADGGQTWTTLDAAPGTTRAVTGLTDTTSYEVQVAAVNAEGTGTFTASQSATPVKAPATLGTPAVSGTTTTSATVTTDVDPGDLGQSVTVEFSTNPDHSAAVASAATTVAGGAPAGPVAVTLEGLTSHTAYYYRVVSKAPDGDVVSSSWLSFTTSKVIASLGTPSVSGVTRSAAKVSTFLTAGDLGQSVTVEYSTQADHSGAVSAVAVPVAGGTPTGVVDVPLAGLASHTTYHYRVVAKASDNDVVATGWSSFTTEKTPAALGAVSVSAVGTKAASVAAVVTPGDLAQDVVVQYTTNADHSGASSSAATSVPGGTGSTTVTTALAALAPGTQFFYRVVLTAADGDTTTGAWASFSTTVAAAPTVSLTADASDVRVGETVKLTWTTGGAGTATASGDWSGPKTVAGGTTDVVVTRAGTHTFTLVAAGEGGTTTATVNVRVALAAKKLVVKAPAGHVHVGRAATVTAGGLVAGESYRITVAGITVGSGVVPASGALSRNVVVPNVLADGTVPVRVVGSVADRAGATTLKVVGAKKLAVKVSKARVATGLKQRVTATGLAAYEKVRIVYAGKQIAVLTASSKGTVTKVFSVGKAVGTRTVKVFGVTNDRTGTKTFKVVR